MFHRLTPKQLAVGVLQYEKLFAALAGSLSHLLARA